MNANFHFGCFGNTVAAARSGAASAASAATSDGTDNAAPPRAIRLSNEPRSMPPASFSSPLRSSSVTAPYLLVSGRRASAHPAPGRCRTIEISYDCVVKRTTSALDRARIDRASGAGADAGPKRLQRRVERSVPRVELGVGGVPGRVRLDHVDD